VEIARSLFFFILAGLCEIGGGYLMWLWLWRWQSHLVCAARGPDPGHLRHHTDLSAGVLRSRLCGIRRRLHRPVHPLGLADRQGSAG